MNNPTQWPRQLCCGLTLLIMLAACAPAGEGPATAQIAPPGPTRSATPVSHPVDALPRPPALTPGIAPERLANLSRGINLPFWFWYSWVEPQDIETRFSDAEFARLRRMGFTYARLPVDGYLFLHPQDPGRPDPVWLKRLDRAIDRLLAADLAVTIDVHNLVFTPSIPDLSDWMEDDETAVGDFSAFWRGLAAHLSKYDPDRVFLEILNEPIFFSQPDLWPSVLATLLAAAREGAPDHTLIASGIYYARIEGLMRLRPVDDPNVIYDFHFYEPFAFTHQGAVWGGLQVSPLHDVPYPSNPELVAPLLLELPVGYPAYETLYDYGRSYSDIASIDEAIRPVAEWSRRYGRAVLCNEFGVYKVYAPRDARLRWLSDVRQTLEKYAIPWAVWEYDGDYGLAARNGDGGLQYDAEILEALGLTLPAR